MLQEVVDANYKFISIEFGCYGKVWRGGGFKYSGLFFHLASGRTPIPNAGALPIFNTIVPYIILGDEAYPLLSNWLKPYKKKRTYMPMKHTLIRDYLEHGERYNTPLVLPILN